MSKNAVANSIKLIVNGQRHTVKNLEPSLSLLDYLRSHLSLTGSKLACGEGGCGACTVMVSRRLPSGELEHRALNSCLVPLYAVGDAEVTTVEGVGSSERPHAVQSALVDAFGSQCGYCTPGFVMSLVTALQRNPQASEQELEKCTDGNLCRCTGYRSISKAIHQLAEDAPRSPLPSALGDHAAEHDARDVHIRGSRFEWYQPKSLAQLLLLKQQHPDAVLVQGASEVAIEQRFGGREYPLLISTDRVGELRRYALSDSAVFLGGGLPLTDLLGEVEGSILALSGPFSSEEASARHAWGGAGVLRALRQQLHWFSGTSVRSGAALAGNLATASPISDVIPLLLATGASIAVQRATDAEPRLVPASDFFTPSYRGTTLEKDEVIVGVSIPLPSSSTTATRAGKISRRREDDIALVTGCLQLTRHRDDDGGVDASLALGGCGASALRVRCALPPDAAEAWPILEKELEAVLDLPPDAVGGMPEFRARAAKGLMFRFLRAAQEDLGLLPRDPSTLPLNDLEAPLPPLPLAGSPSIPSSLSSSSSSSSSSSPLGQSVAHASGMRQVTGEAVYTDDLPRVHGEVSCAVVGSPVPHGRVRRIDIRRALSEPGVLRVLTAADVPGSNLWGDIVVDEEVLADGEVHYVGQPLAVVVAEDEATARRARALIEVEMEKAPRDQMVLDIADARARESFLPQTHRIVKGQPPATAAAAEAGAVRQISGSVLSGGQEHFYFEPNVTLAVPGDGEMQLLASTQNVNKTQMLVAGMLGMPAHRVTCRVRRLGGGFGGKETRTIHWSMLAALAAHVTQRPARLLLSRDEDMSWTGGRHPFESDYSALIDGESGRLRSLTARLFSDAGATHDLSWPVMDRALLHIDNAYDLPHLDAEGRLCRTHKPSNTAFRGFGGPQGMLVVEAAVEQAARAVGRDPQAVRREMLYPAEGARTHFGQPLEHVDLPLLWDTCLERFGYDARLEEAARFNAAHAHRRRGLAVVPTKFGIAFTFPTLNQATCLLHAQTDGSVRIAHGGVEMGQGLHTKVLQVAADALAVPLDRVYISESSSETCANASATAASMGSDLYCQVVYDACVELKERLARFETAAAPNAAPEEVFRQACLQAYLQRVNLTVQRFFAPPEVQGFDFDTQTGRPFRYFTSGVGAAEVEVDLLSGDHRVLRSDVVMDVGKSINPMIDVGQIEGAFVQGQGWLTLEELVWGVPEKNGSWVRPGHLRTNGPGNYKIPSMDDVPRTFNVHLMPNRTNPIAIHSSRAIGEPPFFLGASVMFAIRDAVYRKTGEYQPLVAPLTIERVLNSIPKDF